MMLDFLNSAVQVIAQAETPASASPAAPATGASVTADNQTGSTPVDQASSSPADAASTPSSPPAAAQPVPPVADSTSALGAASSPTTSSVADLSSTTVQNAGTTAVDVAEGGMLHFIGQSDFVGQGLFAILVLMSVVSWYLIFVKSFSNLRTRRRSKKFLDGFWAASSLEQVEHEIATHGASEPFSHLTSHAIHARNHHAKYGALKLEEKGSTGTFVARTIRKVIDEETARLENGLTILASIGSTAPFVGLFGTVWGVYHALIGIGLSDGVSINRIAGPVGEALIMTGLGLAVAIPAVLAYNGFVRNNRVYLASLDAFAHDLFTFLSTGQQVAESKGRGRRVTELRPQQGA
jgi:biopolymer transport protein ExbB